MALRRYTASLAKRPMEHAMQTSQVRLMSWFAHVEEAPKDPILGVTERFIADPNPKKINLGVGAYRDDDGKPVVLDVVKEAEKLIIARNMNNEYLPIGGHREFCMESIRLAYGEDANPIKENRVAVVQALSGTGACRLFAEFQHRWFPSKNSKIYFPNPTWSNHLNIWRDAGVEMEQYPYYDPETKGLAFEKMCDALNKAPSGSAVDRQTLANKEVVGEHYASYQGLNNSTNWAKDVMSGVTDQISTVTAANAKADGYAAIAANPATSDLVVKLVGVAV